MQTDIRSHATESTPAMFFIAHIDNKGAVAPKAIEVKFQQNDIPVARMLTGNSSATNGFNNDSVIPINIPNNIDMNNILYKFPDCKESINGYAEKKIPMMPNKIIDLLLILLEI